MSIELKIILLGEPSVGKSSLLVRFKTGQFPESSSTTVQPDLFVKYIHIGETRVKLCIWDTVGQERYGCIADNYFRGAHGVLLVYDVTNSTTFIKLSKWLDDIRKEIEDAVVIIAGNKNEDPNAQAVTVTMVRNYCVRENLEYVEVSAKTGDNVEMVFTTLAERILTARALLPNVVALFDPSAGRAEGVVPEQSCQRVSPIPPIPRKKRDSTPNVIILNIEEHHHHHPERTSGCC